MPTFPSPRFQLFAPTAPGLESIAAGELKRLGVSARQEVGGVAFGGDLDRVYQANLWLRTASRVVVRLGQFHASTFYELERRAKKMPWLDFLPEKGSVEVRVTCRKSKLYHSDAVADRVLSAIASAATRNIELTDGSSSGDETGEELEEEEAGAVAARAPTQLFIVRIVQDQCEISADSSGELLHRRGYRKEVAKAPLRETLAAAMVLASGSRGRGPLLDPMCGSGTIPIEAALIARGIAPGLNREFQFMNWPRADRGLWNDMIEKARSAVTSPSLDFCGADRDAGAILAATRNAERAGVAGNVRFSVASLSQSIAKTEDVGAGEAWILTNPPYGVRVSESKDLRDLYATLGRALETKRGWRIGVLTPDAPLAAGQLRLPLRARFATSNGGIPVSFLVSEKASKAEARSLETGARRGAVTTDRASQLGNHLTGTIASINTSNGGVPKRCVNDAKVSLLGLVGDAQTDTKHHGGPERAVCLYSLERIRSLRAEGHPIDVGTAGENVTVEGIDWDLIVPGTHLRLGLEVLLEIVSFTSPCKTIRESFIDGRFVRIAQKLHPGWSRVYARVLSEGRIHVGDPVGVALTTE
ncbi:MAG: hypothetical protein NVSMB53_09250 [Gemmatimonadaceae bacterium]